MPTNVLGEYGFTKEDLKLVSKTSNEMEKTLVKKLNGDPDLAILVLCNLISRVSLEGEVPKESIMTVLELALSAKNLTKNMSKEEKKEIEEQFDESLSGLSKKNVAKA